MGPINNEIRFTQLIDALQAGWEIEEPVLLGSIWGQAAGKNGIYHFILKQRVEDKTTLMSVPPSPYLMSFLAENSIRINALT